MRECGRGDVELLFCGSVDALEGLFMPSFLRTDFGGGVWSVSTSLSSHLLEDKY